MKNNVSSRRYIHRIRLEKLKQKTLLLVIMARLLVFLALLIHTYG